MSEKTDNFEISCTTRLMERYKAYATFIRKGGSDSTVPDIHVTTKSGKSFYIEAKLCPAQCGQFVLLPDINTGTFTYSSGNDHRINIYAQKIMDVMNKDFDAFREAGTAGKDIIMPDSAEVFSGWIKQAYKEKGARFFIKNDYSIFPIDDILDHFNITAKYRIKRSGSANVGKSNIPTIRNVIASMDYTITSFRPNGPKLFVESPNQLHDRRFIYAGYEYMFSQRGSEYEIRKLSNTYNANVIFSVSATGNNKGLSDSEFIDELM